MALQHMFDFILGKELSYYVKQHKWLVFIAIVLTTIASLFAVIPAYLLQPFVDQGMKMGSDPQNWKIPWIVLDFDSGFSWQKTEIVLVKAVSPNTLLIILTLVAALSVLLRSITVYFSGLFAAAFSNRAVKSLRIDLFKKFVSLPLGFFHDKKSGELVARATADLGFVQATISPLVIGLIEHPLTATVFLVFLLTMNYKMTLLVFFLGPIIVWIVRLFGIKVKKHAKRVQDATADVTSSYQETLLCLKVVHGFFKGDFQTNGFRTLAETLYQRVMRWERWRIGLGPMMDSTVFLVIPAVLIAGKIFFNHSLGELVAMSFAFSRAYAPVKKLAKVNNSLRSLQGATVRVFGIMNTVPAIRDCAEPKKLPKHKEAIEFKGVNFGYSPEEPVLRDISFKIGAGEMVAFVGSTGAGKSTLLDLIPRFYDVTGGNIFIDGVDIREVTLKSLRSQIGIVNQEIILFHETIANNIRYGKPDATPEKIEVAARTANANDFILAQPKGYQTIVGDQGTMLSGGQRQRIAIARAILTNPAILMMDEAASALDAESEKLVQRAIEALRGKQTILVVAHRLSTIIKADRIHVLEQGRIIESGSAEKLLARNGRFRQLHDMHFVKRNEAPERAQNGH